MELEDRLNRALNDLEYAIAMRGYRARLEDVEETVARVRLDAPPGEWPATTVLAREIESALLSAAPELRTVTVRVPKGRPVSPSLLPLSTVPRTPIGGVNVK